MIKQLLIIGSMIWLGLMPSAMHAGNQRSVSDEAIKAEMITNFAWVVEWPSFAPEIGGKRLVCAMGNSPVANYLEYLIGTAEYESKFIFRRFTNFSHLRYCHILYIDEQERRFMQEVLEATEDYPVLTISNIRQFPYKGGMVGFLHAEKKIGLFSEENVRFSVNLKRASKVYITLDPLLVELAEEVVEE